MGGGREIDRTFGDIGGAIGDPFEDAGDVDSRQAGVKDACVINHHPTNIGNDRVPQEVDLIVKRGNIARGGFIFGVKRLKTGAEDPFGQGALLL